MAFFPLVEDIEIKETKSEIGRDFVFVNGQHIINEKGLLKEYTNEADILKEWIRKVVLTQAGAYEVYTKGESEVFGVSIWEKLGSKERGYFLSELKREITQQLTKSEYIEQIKDFEAVTEGRKVVIRFTAVTKDIEIEQRIVINA